MFNPTQPMLARGRLRLTTKQVNGGYYKGTRTGSMGNFDKRGTYRPDPAKLRVYVAPEKLDNPGKPWSGQEYQTPFLLKPFITKHMRKTPTNYVQDIERNGEIQTAERSFQGTDYLEMWADTVEAEEARRTHFEQQAKTKAVPAQELGRIEQEELETKPGSKSD